jgi:hypothetical protein
VAYGKGRGLKTRGRGTQGSSAAQRKEERAGWLRT